MRGTKMKHQLNCTTHDRAGRREAGVVQLSLLKAELRRTRPSAAVRVVQLV